MKKILCVDDEPYILSTLRRSLRNEQVEIETVPCAEEALDFLEREGPVDMIISDYRMPGMNGIDFLKHAQIRWPGTIGVLLSGYAELATVEAALDEHFIHAHLSKPWKRSELRETILAALDAKSAG